MGAISAAVKGENIAAGALQGAVSGAIAGAAVDLAVPLIAGGTIAVVGGAGIAFFGGSLGSVAGEITHAVVSGEKVELDADTAKRAAAAGALNTLSFGTSSVLEVTKHSASQFSKIQPVRGVKDFFNRAFSGSFKTTVVNGAKEIGYDIMSTFHALQYSIQGSLIGDLFSRRK